MTKEQKKTIDAATKYSTFISKITNPLALRFYLTFYSGKKDKGQDPAPMFRYFTYFCNSLFGINIPINDKNQKEFLAKTDLDSSLIVDLGEVNNFFNTYVDNTTH
jgi:hypothetical protein